MEEKDFVKIYNHELIEKIYFSNSIEKEFMKKDE